VVQYVPQGEIMFAPSTWAEVPGTNGIEIYPIIRKPSIICSSTFIIATPKEVFVIDPGGDRDQVEEVNRTVIPLLRRQALPVYVLLTHCHVDHFVAAPFLDERMKPIICCHAVAARALEERNGSATMAEMIDMELPTLEVGGSFFAGNAQGPIPTRIKKDRIDLPSGRSVQVESYAIGDGDTLDVFETPGHSPDGLAFRVGPLLFTGDLHMATTPGIAGLKGWDNMQLAASLEALTTAGREAGTTVVMPGHGIPLPFDKAAKIFGAVRAEALGLSDLEVLNRERADYLSDFAVVLLEEAGTIFSTIAGRLLKVAHYLELLEEEEHAAEVLQSLDTAAIDAGLDEFYYFIAELKGTGGVPLISKAVQFVKGIEKVFEPDRVSSLVDECLLRRLRSLLGDFVNAAYGVRFRNQETHFNLDEAIPELLGQLSINLHASETIFESLDAKEEFLRELAGRIAYTPLFTGTMLAFEGGLQGTCTVSADKGRLQDCVSALLEQFAIHGVAHVSLEIGKEEDRPVLLVTAETAGPGSVRGSKLSYLRHSAQLAGAAFDRVAPADGDGAERYLFRFLAPNGS
jgi:glyoxylase-like metal-dependent hydrolase (beta-lactamase superfamily II)